MTSFPQLHTEPSQTLRQALDPLKRTQILSPDEVLFRRGDRTRGIYLVEKGSVHLYLDDASFKAEAAGFASPGAILGLSETISGHAYSTTAVAAEELTVSFVPRLELLRFLRRDCGQCLQVVQQLSEDLYLLYQLVRESAASHSRKHYPRYVH